MMLNLSLLLLLPHLLLITLILPSPVHTNPSRSDDVLILATVLGSLHGISENTGALLWSTSFDTPSVNPDSTNNRAFGFPTPPLISTVTSLIPSTDSYIYTLTPNNTLLRHYPLSIPALVSQSPFVDATNRVFAGSKKASAVGLDKLTGRVMSVLDATGMYDVVGEEGDVNPDEEEVVWIGRNDYDITVYDIAHGKIEDVLKSTVVMSAEEMLGAGTAPGSSPQLHTISPPTQHLILTPDGDVALLESPHDKYTWRTRYDFDSPVTAAIKASTRAKVPLRVTSTIPPPTAIFSTSADQTHLVLKTLPNGQQYAVPVVTPFKAPFGGKELQELPDNVLLMELSREYSGQIQQFQNLYHALQGEVPGAGSGSYFERAAGAFFSWLPTILGVTVVGAFEAGRRRRMKLTPRPAEPLVVAPPTVAPPPVPLNPPQPSISSSISIDIDTILGYGGNGTVVYAGTFSGRRVAVKRMLATFEEDVAREIELLIRSDESENVIRYHATEVSPNKDFIYLALELCDMSLTDALIATPTRFRLDTNALLQIAKGLAHLHSQRIVHRDIKPQNILLLKDVLKISDMGLGRMVPDGHSKPTASATGNVGSIGWQAPEVMAGTQAAGFKSDVFSAGCVFYMMLSGGNHPFGLSWQRESNIMNHQPTIDESLVTPPAEDLIRQMLDPSVRPPITEIIRHPLFWGSEQRLRFLMELSDRLEKEGAVGKLGRMLEKGADKIIGSNFMLTVHESLMRDAAKYRFYDVASVVDCLRLIRNKSSHRNALNAEVLEEIGGEGKVYEYFEDKFPKLFMHCWSTEKEEGGELEDEGEEEDSQSLDIVTYQNSDLSGDGGGGWLRSDAEWGEGSDLKAKQINTAKKQRTDALLSKMAADFKFRTKMCSTMEKGEVCVFEGKGKCVFAHSACELRVAAGKRGKWGGEEEMGRGVWEDSKNAPQQRVGGKAKGRNPSVKR